MVVDQQVKALLETRQEVRHRHRIEFRKRPEQGCFTAELRYARLRDAQSLRKEGPERRFDVEGLRMRFLLHGWRA